MIDFNQWFSGSVIAKENGEPLPVYHGTPFPAFDEFQLDSPRATGHEAGTIGFWFTSDFKVASGFAHTWKEKWETDYEDRWADGEPKKYRRQYLVSGKVYKCFLNLQNPAWYGGEDSDGFEEMMDDRDAFAAYIDTIKHPGLGFDEQQGRYVRSRVPERHWRKRMIAYGAGDTNIDFRLFLESMGHDGLVILNTLWDAEGDNPNDQFVAWNSDQIWIAEQLEPDPEVDPPPQY